MKLYTTCFTTKMGEKNQSHNALVAIKKEKTKFFIKWNFFESFDSRTNATTVIKFASNEKEAFEKFIKNELDFANVEIITFTQVRL